MKIRKRDIGHRCTVVFDEEGYVDAMLLGKAVSAGNQSVFLFANQLLTDVADDQIIEIGGLILPRSH